MIIIYLNSILNQFCDSLHPIAHFLLLNMLIFIYIFMIILKIGLF